MEVSGGHRLIDLRDELVADDSGFKRCAKCGLMKPRTEFARDQRLADGRTVYCKSCRNRKDRERNSQLDGYMRNLAKSAGPQGMVVETVAAGGGERRVDQGT